MSDAWRAYLEMALGLTEVPRKRAQKVANELVNRGGATAAQLQGLVEDLMGAGMANREALTNIVRYEVDRALGKVGLATADEVADLTTRVRELEKQLRAAEARAAAAETGGLIAREAVGADGGIGGERLNRPAPLPARTAKKAAAKKAAKATPNAMPAAGTTPAPAKKVTGTPAPAKKAARKTLAKKAPAGTSASPVAGVAEAAAATDVPATPADMPAKKVAKKAPAKKAPAKKAAPGTTLPEA
jgi:polyhydroxyalkanoate synthesis regulator phasin